MNEMFHFLLPDLSPVLYRDIIPVRFIAKDGYKIIRASPNHTWEIVLARSDFFWISISTRVRVSAPRKTISKIFSQPCPGDSIGENPRGRC